jgi:hypothetical protein
MGIARSPFYRGFSAKRDREQLRQWWSVPEEGTKQFFMWWLDRLVSEIVRRRDGQCVTCKTRSGLTCSHYFKRGFLWTRWNLQNCNAQCADCNRTHNTNPFPYRAYMSKVYGEDVIEELFTLRNSKLKFEAWQMAELLDRLKAEYPTEAKAVEKRVA